MSSDKRYTSQNITKRVDHEAGRHRTRRASAEPMVCEMCGNIYADRRWSKPDPERPQRKHEHFRPAQPTVCPACQAERDRTPSGYVHLDGLFLKSHREEIEKLLRNEAERAEEDNPLARIIGWEKDRRGRATVRQPPNIWRRGSAMRWKKPTAAKSGTTSLTKTNWRTFTGGAIEVESRGWRSEIWRRRLSLLI